VISLRRRYGFIVVTFIIGGLLLLYGALEFDERIAFTLPGWLLISFLLMLFAVRCPRCKFPATVEIVRFGRLRVWVPAAGINDKCPSCGADLHRPHAAR
jgi:purine-cytosine permease-like protein